MKLYDIDGEAADEFAELQMTAMPEVGDILIIEGTSRLSGRRIRQYQVVSRTLRLSVDVNGYSIGDTKVSLIVRGVSPQSE